MSSASFLKEPYLKTELCHNVYFDNFFENPDRYLFEDPLKILGIVLNVKRLYYCYTGHKDALKYMLKIVRFSKEDLKEYFY